MAKTRAAHNAAIDELKKLMDEKKALQSKELADAISKSKRSEFSGAAEPPFRWRVSQVSGRN